VRDADPGRAKQTRDLQTGGFWEPGELNTHIEFLGVSRSETRQVHPERAKERQDQRMDSGNLGNSMHILSSLEFRNEKLQPFPRSGWELSLAEFLASLHRVT